MKKKKYFNNDCNRTHRKNEILRWVQLYPVKKYFVLTLLLLAITIILRAKSDSYYGPTPTPECGSRTINYTFSNVQAWGDKLLQTQSYNNLSDFLNEDFSVDITIKATKDCTFTWNKKYTKTDKDVSGNTINNISVPISTSTQYSITVKVESPCVKDTYLDRTVKLVWSKTLTTAASDLNLGYPQQQDCTPTRTSSSRSVAVSNYVNSGRVSSSSTRTRTSTSTRNINN